MKTTSETNVAVTSTPANTEVAVASPAAANTEEMRHLLREYLEVAYQHQARTLEVLGKAIAITRRRSRDRRDVDIVI